MARPYEQDASTLARVWIDSWNQGTPEKIPLSANFTHTSPFGVVNGKQAYLDWVKPMAQTHLIEHRILRVLSDGNQATIHFEMRTPVGPIEVCDWLRVERGEIIEVQSFYDATELRKNG